MCTIQIDLGVGSKLTWLDIRHSVYIYPHNGWVRTYKNHSEKK